MALTSSSSTRAFERNSLQQVKTLLQTERDKALRLMGQRDGLQQSLSEMADKEKAKAVEIEQLQAIAGAFETLAQQEHEAGLEGVEQFVTRGLQQVFQDESYRFRVDVQQKSAGGGTRRPVARFKVGHIVGDREVWSDVKDGHGTGLAEVVGLLLRVAMVASQKDLAPVVILDDPVAHLPPIMVERVVSLIQELSKEIQFVLTTTEPTLASIGNKRGNVTYRFERDGHTIVARKVR